ncbi:hypothetical protein FOZ62_011856, partial [Perkinsus olseni]
VLLSSPVDSSCDNLIDICSKDSRVRSANTSDPSQFCTSSCVAYHVCTSSQDYTHQEVQQYFDCPLDELKLQMKRHLYEISYQLRMNCHHTYLDNQPVEFIGGTTLDGGLVRYLKDVCPEMDNVWPNV